MHTFLHWTLFFSSITLNTQKESILNLAKSKPIWIVSALFQLLWHAPISVQWRFDQASLFAIQIWFYVTIFRMNCSVMLTFSLLSAGCRGIVYGWWRWVFFFCCSQSIKREFCWLVKFARIFARIVLTASSSSAYIYSALIIYFRILENRSKFCI